MLHNFDIDPEDDKPQQIHLGYSYGTAAFPIDEQIVRRIRFDADPLFVPVIKTEVFLYATGGTREFVHFGFGCEHTPGLPVIDPEVYNGSKPHFGYLSKLPRASFVSVWAQGPPFAPELPEDGTPGVTVPFDERVYRHAVECNEEMRRRAARDLAKNPGDTEVNVIPGVNDEVRQLAFRAITTSREERRAAKDKPVEDATNALRFVLRDEKKHNASFLDLTDEERMLMGELHRKKGEMRNPVHFIPTAPAKPGSIIVVPR